MNMSKQSPNKLLQKILEEAYKLALKTIEERNFAKILVQGTNVLIPLTVSEVLSRLALKETDSKVIELFKFLFFTKAKEGKVSIPHRDARIVIKPTISDSKSGIIISEYLPPIKWIYVYLPLTYYEKVRKEILQE